MARGFKTGGRKAGTPNRATVDRQLRAISGIRAAVEDGLLPLDVMLARMRGDGTITDQQFEAAVAAAPYVHPKLAAVAVHDKKQVSELSDDELRAIICRRLHQLYVDHPAQPVPLTAEIQSSKMIAAGSSVR